MGLNYDGYEALELQQQLKNVKQNNMRKGTIQMAKIQKPIPVQSQVDKKKLLILNEEEMLSRNLTNQQVSSTN